jgi:two-component system, LytTR family, sensor kinase
MYLFTLFILVFALDLISASKFGKQAFLNVISSPFNLSQLVCTLFILLLCRYVFRRIYGRGKILLLVSGVAGLIVTYILSRYMIEEMICPVILGYGNYHEGTTIQYYFLDNIYYAVIYVAIGFFLFIMDRLFTLQKHQIQLANKTREAELQFLRSQVNPHFLFNTLNNIYSLVYEKSSKAPDAVLRLSELMLYILYEKKETVPLETEWKYIEIFIELQKLRFDERCIFPTELQGDISKFRIAPHLLIPLVENAFKHGDFRITGPIVSINLITERSDIIFTVKNRIVLKSKDETGGVGLENIKRRLELVYPGKHRLDISIGDQLFTARLWIQLKV